MIRKILALSMIIAGLLTSCAQEDECKICTAMKTDKNGVKTATDITQEACGEEVKALENDAANVSPLDSSSTKWECK